MKNITGASISTPPQKKRSFYLPQLDALRFFAFFAVLVHHTAIFGVPERLFPLYKLLLRSCAFGLSLFFFLSSYLITTLLAQELEASGTIALKSFFIRRVLRIWPLYFVYIGCIWLVGQWYAPFHMENGRLLAMSTLAANWYWIAFGPGCAAVIHLWSISVEEQFYLAWPWTFRKLGPRRMVYASVIIALLATVGTAVLASTGARNVWFNSLVESLYFAGGAILALVLPRVSNFSLPVSVLQMFSGVALWVIAEKIGHIKNESIALNPATAVVAYLLVAVGCATLLMGAMRFPPHLVPKWLIYLGRISYGLYVFHLISWYFVRQIHLPKAIPGELFLINAGVVIGLASLSYKWLETPFLKLKGKFEIIRTRAV